MSQGMLKEEAQMHIKAVLSTNIESKAPTSNEPVKKQDLSDTHKQGSNENMHQPKVKEIEDPWFRLSMRKSPKELENKAKLRARKLLITSELGVKPLSYSDLNTNGIMQENSSSTSMGTKAKNTFKMIFIPPERLNNMLQTKALHQKYAPSLIDFSYSFLDSELSKERYLYRKYKLPPLC